MIAYQSEKWEQTKTLLLFRINFSVAVPVQHFEDTAGRSNLCYCHGLHYQVGYLPPLW